MFQSIKKLLVNVFFFGSLYYISFGNFNVTRDNIIMCFFGVKAFCLDRCWKIWHFIWYFFPSEKYNMVNGMFYLCNGKFWDNSHADKPKYITSPWLEGYKLKFYLYGFWSEIIDIRKFERKLLEFIVCFI